MQIFWLSKAKPRSQIWLRGFAFIGFVKCNPPAAQLELVDFLAFFFTCFSARFSFKFFVGAFLSLDFDGDLPFAIMMKFNFWQDRHCIPKPSQKSSHLGCAHKPSSTVNAVRRFNWCSSSVQRAQTQLAFGTDSPKPFADNRSTLIPFDTR